MKRAARYRIESNRRGLQLTFDQNFWNDTIVRARDGTTQLDINITTIIQEIRSVLYFVATQGADLRKH